MTLSTTLFIWIPLMSNWTLFPTSQESLAICMYFTITHLCFDWITMMGYSTLIWDCPCWLGIDLLLSNIFVQIIPNHIMISINSYASHCLSGHWSQDRKTANVNVTESMHGIQDFEFLTFIARVTSQTPVHPTRDSSFSIRLKIRNYFYWIRSIPKCFYL